MGELRSRGRNGITVTQAVSPEARGAPDGPQDLQPPTDSFGFGTEARPQRVSELGFVFLITRKGRSLGPRSFGEVSTAAPTLSESILTSRHRGRRLCGNDGAYLVQHCSKCPLSLVSRIYMNGGSIGGLIQEDDGHSVSRTQGLRY